MRHFLVIDNEDQTDIITVIEQKVRKDGIDAKGHYFNPAKTECWVEGKDENGEPEFFIDLDLVLAQVESELKGQPINFIFSDYKLEDKNVTGLDVVRLLLKHWRKVPAVMYSADDDLLMSQLEEEWEQQSFSNFKEKFKWITDHFDHSPSKVYNRGGYDDKVVEYIKKSSYNMDQILLDKLEEYPDKEFQNIHPQFEGKTLGQIASSIRKNTGESDRFRSELLERSIAHYIDLKE